MKSKNNKNTNNFNKKSNPPNIKKNQIRNPNPYNYQNQNKTPLQIQREKDLKLEEEFKKKIATKGYLLHQMKRDGNCLFTSVSDQIYGDEKYHKLLREKCMEYISKNKAFFSLFIEGDFEHYVNRKKKLGIWGDNVEIQALSDIYQRPVEIYEKIEKPIVFCKAQMNKNKYPIRLSYHGHKHYNSLIPLMRNDKEYSLYKSQKLTSKPGIYEDNFIKNSEILSCDFGNDEFKNFKNNDDVGYVEEEKNFEEEENKYLEDPIVQDIMELGFNLEDVIEGIKVCGNNKELVVNYLMNKNEYS